MDKPTSHFYKGIGPTSERNCLSNFESVGGGDGDNYSVPFLNASHHAPPQQQPSTCSVNMNVQYHENWKLEDVECKQESEAMALDSYLDSANQFGPSDAYNDSFHYGYNNNNAYYRPSDVPSQRNNALYRSSHQNGSNSATFSPYQISAASKSQLPAWYEPPQPVHRPSHLPFAPPPPHPSYYHHQQPSASFYPYQSNYMASTATAASSDHNMRNMIQMTNRYST